MEIVNLQLLRRCARRRRGTKEAIDYWINVVRAADWRTPYDVGRVPVRTERLGGKRFVFKLWNNRYRLVAVVNYELGSVEVRFFGTHAEYDRINAREI